MTVIKDITKAIVENGVMVRRTLDEVVNIGGINYRTDDPDAKAVGVYEYWYEEPSIPAGKKVGVPNRVIDAVAGTVTDTPTYIDMTALEKIAAIEATITNRRIREAALTPEGKTWLEQADAAITALRQTLIVIPTT
jgi:hypothetical protein